MIYRDFRQNFVNIDGPKRKVGVRKSLSGKTVGTVDRYRYENADGSITWGYKNEDGSFKVRMCKSNHLKHENVVNINDTNVSDDVQEETIGVDCITHGRYGYVDPAGEQR